MMAGNQILHYKILRELGRGGMGVVYKAQDIRLDRLVALKFLPPYLSQSEEDKQRFLHEARAASALDHANICTIFEIDETEDGQMFIAMAYCEGETLKSKILASGQLSIDDAVEYAIQIARGLQAAHEKGVVHRDIKPANIIINDRNQVKIVDFGLAKLPGRTGHTKEGAIIGTAAYMSPEQARGDAVDHRADIWALGVVLYEMLTGALPFKGEYEQVVIYSILSEEPPLLKAQRPDVPDELEDIIAKALKKELSQRYQNLQEMLTDLMALHKKRHMNTEAAESLEKPGSSIAVLAFSDMSPQKDQDYFCEGLAEELISALSKIRTLRVASRTSAFAFKGRRQDIREIGRKLNVESVLEGSVRKAGNRLRVTAQLINVADGFHLWSERYDRTIKDVFEIQDEIVENIVLALRVVLSQKEKRALAQTFTTDVEAYDYYLRGRKFMYQARRKSLRFAIQMFTRAAEIDPGYALAYAGIADCYCWLYMFWESTAENLRLAEEASQKALQLAPDLAEAHVSRGHALSLSRQYEEAEKAFETAIYLNPTLFEAYYFYARACWPQGKYEAAAGLLERACQVRPDDYQAPLLLAGLYKGLGWETKALGAYRQGLRIAEQHLELNPDDARALYLGASAHIQLGDPQRGLEWANLALEMDPEDPAILYNVACVYAEAAEIDRSLNCLEKAINLGYAHRDWIEYDPDLDPLRQHPRFKTLLASMKK